MEWLTKLKAKRTLKKQFRRAEAEFIRIIEEKGGLLKMPKIELGGELNKEQAIQEVKTLMQRFEIEPHELSGSELPKGKPNYIG